MEAPLEHNPSVSAPSPPPPSAEGDDPHEVAAGAAVSGAAEKNQPLLTGAAAAAAAVEAARCGCCGLTEDCTASYIERVRVKHGGLWVCGLCAEAVQEEVRRRLVTPEEALRRHIAFCGAFRRSSSPATADAHAAELIAALRQLLRRGLDSPRGSPAARGGATRRAPWDVGSESGERKYVKGKLLRDFS